MTQFRITIDNTGETFKCSAETNVLEAMQVALCKGSRHASRGIRIVELAKHGTQ